MSAPSFARTTRLSLVLMRLASSNRVASQLRTLCSTPKTPNTPTFAAAPSSSTQASTPPNLRQAQATERVKPLSGSVDKASFNAVTIENLMNARVHMGHRKKLWNPKMAPYVLGHRNDMHIINLDTTLPLLRRALTAVSLMAEHDCTFLWLGPRDPQKATIIDKQARQAGAYTIDGARWIGGTLTNPIESRQAKRFQYRVPDCVFVIDLNRHMPALKEAKLCGIPTVGIADSDCDPTMLTYPIPGNDDNALAVYLYCSLMKHAIQDGRSRGRRLNRPSMQIPNISQSHTRQRSQGPPRPRI